MNYRILEMAQKLQYVSANNDRLAILIDGKSIELSKDEFTSFVRQELQTGKTLVSAIRDTVFKRIRQNTF